MKIHSIAAIVFFLIGVVHAGTAPYAISRGEARRLVREYCRATFGPKSTNPMPSQQQIFERALQGEFKALQNIFNDLPRKEDDPLEDELPWYILHAIGHNTYAGFVAWAPAEERKHITSFFVRGVDFGKPGDSKRFALYFQRNFPRTRALSEKYNPPAPPEPEKPGFDYGPRRLGQELANESRFAAVRIYQHSTNAAKTVVVAPKSLSQKDAADLRALVQKHLGGNGVLEFR